MPTLPKAVRVFSRTLVKVEDRLLILTTCKYCGEARIAAPLDIAIDDWEDKHQCKNLTVSWGRA